MAIVETGVLVQESGGKKLDDRSDVRHLPPPVAPPRFPTEKFLRKTLGGKPKDAEGEPSAQEPKFAANEGEQAHEAEQLTGVLVQESGGKKLDDRSDARHLPPPVAPPRFPTEKFLRKTLGGKPKDAEGEPSAQEPKFAANEGEQAHEAEQLPVFRGDEVATRFASVLGAGAEASQASRDGFQIGG